MRLKLYNDLAALPTDKDRRHSPQHTVPADPPPIRPAHKSSALKQTKDPFDEIHRMLQVFQLLFFGLKEMRLVNFFKVTDTDRYPCLHSN